LPRRAPGRAEAVRRCERSLRPRHGHRLCQGAVPIRPVLVRRARRSARLRPAGDARRLLPEPDGDRREPVLDAGCPQPDPPWRPAPGPGLAAVRLRAQLRTGGVPAHPRDAARPWLVAVALHSPRRAPDVAEHRGGTRTRRQRILSGPLPALRRLSGRRGGRGRPRHAARAAGHRVRRQGGPLPSHGSAVVLMRRALACMAVAALAACTTGGLVEDRPDPMATRATLERLLPDRLPDRDGWARDIERAFTALSLPADVEHLCAALAVTEQESSFRADPAVP